MELVVLGSSGIAGDSIISIRAGQVRKQAALQAVDKPFKFPCAVEECRAIEVEVFHVLGTARGYLAGGEPGDIQLQLRSPSQAAVAAGEAPLTISLRIQRAGEANAEEDANSHAIRKAKLKSETDRYLEEHQVVLTLQNALQVLIKEKPEDPVAFMARHFVEKLPAPAAETSPESPTAPRNELQRATTEARSDWMKRLHVRAQQCLDEATEIGNYARSVKVWADNTVVVPEIKHVSLFDPLIIKIRAKRTLKVAMKQEKLKPALKKVFITEVHEEEVAPAPVEEGPHVPDLKVIKEKAKAMLFAALASGKLNEVLVEAVPEDRVQIARIRARVMLRNAIVQGKFDAVLNKVTPNEILEEILQRSHKIFDPTVVKLRARLTLKHAVKSGALDKVLEAKVTPPQEEGAAEPA